MAYSKYNHLKVVIKFLFLSSHFNDSSGLTTMFQIDDLTAEIKRIDHVSAREIKQIMHTNIDTMGPCVLFITILANYMFESAVELSRTG
jgi:hypothetical protein